ncbi:transcription termination factor 4, mitochondrial [Stigmatopora nigra]
MNNPTAFRRVLCILRSTSSSIYSLFQSGSYLQRSCIRRKLFCSKSSNQLLPGEGNNEQASIHRTTSPELPLSSLLDMGFTPPQAEEIYQSLSKVRNGSATKNRSSTLMVLFMLGFNPSSVGKILTKCPDLYNIDQSLLKQRIDNLRKLGLVEGSLQRVVSHYPAILATSVKAVKYKTVFLKEKCLFTMQQVTEILRDSPAIVHEDQDQLEYKFQYVFFRMGIKQAQMVKHKLFRSTLEELRWRHSFLERRGLYQTPDKNGQTLIVNPKLDSIINVDLESFLARAAGASAEEYVVFQKLLAREWQEEERHHGDGSDDDYSDDEDEEEEIESKDSYRKRRRNNH